MRLAREHKNKFDFLSIGIYLVLIGFGWLNIYAATVGGNVGSIFDLSQPYGKQLLFIGLSLLMAFVIFAIDAKFYERFASIIYLAGLVLLLGLFVIGKEINGATSWYAIGSFTLQPSEFVKVAVCLALAKYLSDMQTSIARPLDQLNSILLVLIPSFFILLQNDAGSTLVFLSFFFVMFREGLPNLHLYILVFIACLALFAIKFGIVYAIGFSTAILLLQPFISKGKYKLKLWRFLAIIGSGVVAVLVRYFYANILQPHQRDRLDLWLGFEDDPEKLASLRRTVLYNLNESQKAISSGGFTGKGFLQGTRTIGNFVPEQHTDYIFSTVGEEWGFLGSSLVVILFMGLMLRVLFLANLQKNPFSRIYGMGVVAVFFTHFTINIGMVIGLFPTVGIPLPFFSYGGSSLWGFTILLFIFLKLDSNRLNEW